MLPKGWRQMCWNNKNKKHTENEKRQRNQWKLEFFDFVTFFKTAEEQSWCELLHLACWFWPRCYPHICVCGLVLSLWRSQEPYFHSLVQFPDSLHCCSCRYTSEPASKEAAVSITDSSLEYGAFWGLNEFLVNVMWPSKQTRFLRKLSGRRSKLKSERKSSQRKKIKKEKFDSLENGKKRGEAHYFYTVFELFIKLH